MKLANWQQGLPARQFPAPSGSTTPIIVAGSNTKADADAINAAIAAGPKGAEIVIRGKCLINKTIRLLPARRPTKAALP